MAENRFPLNFAKAYGSPCARLTPRKPSCSTDTFQPYCRRGRQPSANVVATTRKLRRPPPAATRAKTSLEICVCPFLVYTHTFASRVKIRKSALTANLAHPPFRHRVRRRSFPFTFTPTARPVSLPHFPDIGPARGRLLPAAAALRPAIWPRGRVCIHSKNTKLCTY